MNYATGSIINCMNRFTRYLIYLLLPLTLLSGCLYFLQPLMAFIPYRELIATPDNWGMRYEAIQLQTDDSITLHGWFLPADQPNTKQALLFFHGNAGNISHRRDSLKIFNRLGLDVLIIDYRGYGQSEGSPDEQGLYRDAEAAWSYLRKSKDYKPQQIIIFGRSMGGAVAAWLASKLDLSEQPAGLILESTFASAREFAEAVFPVLPWITPLRFEFNTTDNLQTVHCPILVLHSPDDEIIPYTQGQKVFEAAHAPKQFHEMRGDHNGGFLLSQPEYEHALAQFISRLQQTR